MSTARTQTVDHARPVSHWAYWAHQQACMHGLRKSGMSGADLMLAEALAGRLLVA